MKNELINSLNISPDAIKIVEEYLQELNNFIKKHNLDKELYSDLEERLYEKLSEEKSITKVKVLKAIYEIGEPADIFGIDDTESLLDKIDTNKITKGSINIAKNTGAELFSLINKLYNFVLNILIKLKNLILGIIKYTWSIFIKVWNHFMSSENILLKITIKIISFCYSSLGLVIFIIGIFGIGLIPIQFLDIGIDNQIYTRGMDIFLKIGLSLLALGTTTLGAVIYKKTLSKVPSLLAVGLLFTFALSLSILGGFNTIKNFSYKSTQTQEIIIPLSENQDKIILEDFDLYGNEYFIFDGELENIDVRFKKLDDDTKRIKIKIENTIHTKDNTKAKEIFNNINKIKSKLEINKLNLFRENNSTFINPIEFVWLQREIKIYIPKNLKIETKLGDWGDNISLDIGKSGEYIDKYEHSKHYYNSGCKQGIITYNDNDYNDFVCDLNPEDK